MSRLFEHFHFWEALDVVLRLLGGLLDFFLNFSNLGSLVVAGRLLGGFKEAVGRLEQNFI